MSLLEKLALHSVWQEFYSAKAFAGNLGKKQAAELLEFVEQKRYLPITEKILTEGFCFAPPVKKLVNKSGTGKKRTVYRFCDDENWVLKLLAHLFYRFDGYFSPNLYSFRKNLCVKNALTKLTAAKEINSLYCYKADIQNYFNSIDISLLIPLMKEVFGTDAPLFEFMRNMLTADICVQDGVLIKEKRGVMAGTPTSPFFANVYLTYLDRLLLNKGIVYARYSDDIILFANTAEELENCRNLVHEKITQARLKINPEKEQILPAGVPWSFLGIQYYRGEIDLSPVTLAKIKAKIRRKGKALHRWKNRKGASDTGVLKAMIRRFHKKFFLSGGKNDLTWSRWFFPLITTGKSLKIVDSYLQDYLRFAVTGRHKKSNYKKVPYSLLKEHGYETLFNRYYQTNSEKYPAPVND